MKFCEFLDINPKEKLKRNEEYPFIEMTDIIPGNRFICPKKKIYKGEGAKFTSRDVLFTRITPWLENGKIAQVKLNNDTKCFGSTEFFIFRAKKDVSDKNYPKLVKITTEAERLFTFLWVKNEPEMSQMSHECANWKRAHKGLKGDIKEIKGQNDAKGIKMLLKPQRTQRSI